jgi:DNA-binding FadR family transcriptional regulator
MFQEAHASRPPSLLRLAMLLGVPRDDVQDALDVLEKQGLVDARRARLTFIGLAVAASTRAAAGKATSTLAA